MIFCGPMKDLTYGYNYRNLLVPLNFLKKMLILMSLNLHKFDDFGNQCLSPISFASTSNFIIVIAFNYVVTTFNCDYPFSEVFSNVWFLEIDEVELDNVNKVGCRANRHAKLWWKMYSMNGGSFKVMILKSPLQICLKMKTL